jgi:hypothetical protein
VERLLYFENGKVFTAQAFLYASMNFVLWYIVLLKRSGWEGGGC